MGYTTKATDALEVGDLFVGHRDERGAFWISRITEIQPHPYGARVDYEGIDFINEAGRQMHGEDGGLYVGDPYCDATGLCEIVDFPGLAVVIEVVDAKTGKMTHTRQRKNVKTHRPGCRHLGKPGRVRELPERFDPWNKCAVPAEIEIRAHWPSLGPITCKACAGAK